MSLMPPDQLAGQREVETCRAWVALKRSIPIVSVHRGLRATCPILLLKGLPRPCASSGLISSIILEFLAPVLPSFSGASVHMSRQVPASRAGPAVASFALSIGATRPSVYRASMVGEMPYLDHFLHHRACLASGSGGHQPRDFTNRLSSKYRAFLRADRRRSCDHDDFIVGRQLH